VLVGNDAALGAAIRHGRGVVTMVPVTTNPAIRGRMHVPLRPTRLNGLHTSSKAQIEQIRSIDVNRLRAGLGRLGPNDLDAIDEALRYHLAL
jgi:mRNA interferase MazF